MASRTPDKAENGDRLITPKRAADLLAVTPQTVKKYIYSGQLPSVTTPGGHHRLRESDVRALLTPSQPHRTEAPPPARERDPLIEVVRSLVTVIERLHDTFEPGHGERVADHARALAGEMGMGDEEQESIWLAGLLHDVGKLMVEPALLRKKQPLTASELHEVQQHPTYGGEILGNMRELSSLTETVRHHHERQDGSGYPDGLGGDDIPTAAKILSIAEAYDSMRSDAAYRGAMDRDQAIAEVVAGAGTQYDPMLVATFVQTVN